MSQMSQCYAMIDHYNKCRSQWPIFPGLVILPYILENFMDDGGNRLDFKLAKIIKNNKGDVQELFRIWQITYM